MTQEDKQATLRCSEALTKDVGRGIARIDPEQMEKLGVQVGDVVEIAGKRATVAKVMPTYMQDRGKDVVQVDGITRDNAQVGLGDKLTVKKAEYKPARTVALNAIGNDGAVAKVSDTKYIGKLLDGLAVVSGDKVRAIPFGTRYQGFTVVDTNPHGPVVIHSSTGVKMRRTRGKAAEDGEEPGAVSVTYEDIGGLRKEIQRIREMIELPLRHPELFEKLGIGAPRGVLLHGPPGCGKTLIARAVANETDAYFIQVSGPEIIHKFYGESEANLRAIFENAAAQAPAIVFMDELDAIASKREDTRGDQQVERRVVAQLLALMDGIQSRGQVIVIGATNIPNVLDPALRRPGRFDREIGISIPDRNGRLEILEIHTRGMPLAEDVDLNRLADITHGFVGADLEALCREAAMITLRKIMPQIEFETEHISVELLSQLEVTMNDFMEALKEVEPSAIREVFTEIPNVKWEDVGGLQDIKRVLKETIEWPLHHPEVFRHANTRPAKGILLTGSPGTGKTLLARAVASESGVNFISIKGPALLSRWVGESERGVREVFKKAKQASPCIVFFDEIDSLVPRRGAGADTSVTERVISQFLAELDGIEELTGVVVLAATNRPDIIDPALMRAGRFDIQLALPVPDEDARLEILKVHSKGKPLAKDVTLAELARVSEGMVGSDLESLCRKASMLAIREFLDKSGEQPSEAEIAKLTVRARHFDAVLRESGRSLKAEKVKV